jgi:hypothetical protein
MLFLSFLMARKSTADWISSQRCACSLEGPAADRRSAGCDGRSSANLKIVPEAGVKGPVPHMVTLMEFCRLFFTLHFVAFC